jgi:hypothetical protein
LTYADVGALGLHGKADKTDTLGTNHYSYYDTLGNGAVAEKLDITDTIPYVVRGDNSRRSMNYGSTDMDSLPEYSTFYRYLNSPNAPITGGGIGIKIQHPSQGYATDIVSPVPSVSNTSLYFRKEYAGEFGEWLSIWNSGNLDTSMFLGLHDKADSAGVSENADSLDHQDSPYYLDRSNHTGTQDTSTITGLSAMLAGKEPVLTKGNLTASGAISIDQTRQVIGGAAAISHSTAAGYKHVPTGGSSGQFLKFGGSSGTAAWSEHGLTYADVGALGLHGKADKTDTLGTNHYSYYDTLGNGAVAEKLDGPITTYIEGGNVGQLAYYKATTLLGRSTLNANYFKIDGNDLITAPGSEIRPPSQSIYLGWESLTEGSHIYVSDTTSTTGTPNSIYLETSGSNGLVLVNTDTLRITGSVEINSDLNLGSHTLYSNTITGSFFTPPVNVHAGGSGFSPNAFAKVIIEDSASCALQLLCPTSTAGGPCGQFILFNNSGGLAYLPESDVMYAITNDTQRVAIYGDGGMVVGSPTGLSKGHGTINAVGVYDDNVLLTGYVLDKAYNPDCDESEWNKKAPVASDEFFRRSEMHFDVDKYSDFIKSKKMLPTFEDVESSGNIPSTGAMIQKLWEVVEVQAVHIQQLNDRIKKLEEDK